MSKHRTRTTKWNRLLSGILCLALMLGLLPAAGLVRTARAANWADPYGQRLVEWGVMSPSSDLRLGDTITRAEFVAMCNRAFGYKKLGTMPFTDVPSSAWYAQDINIAYNAGYFNGTSSDAASPNATLTREQAAVLLARNMMLQETVGESMGFTDSRDLNDWSSGLIGAAVAEGMITGYGDGSYRPFNSITRGEVAAMLVRAIGTPVSKAGNHELGDVYGNVTISSSNATLRNTVILGNLYVTGGVDLGNVLLENVTVLGRIVISGGGESNAAQSSVILRNVAADELVVDSMVDQFVTVSAYGLTDIPNTYVRSDAFLEDDSTPGFGLDHIELVGKDGALLQIAGSIKEVVNKTPFSQLQLVKGTAETITIDEYARGAQLVVGTGTRIDTLNLDVATLVTGDANGKGDIINLNIGAADCEVDILPEHVEVRPGITASIDGETVTSTSAAELSSEPRLLAGYPRVDSLKPTEAEGLYAGNKPGTIYWAVSAVADGSVSPEDLINNPAYGGNIYKNNAGSFTAGTGTDYGRLISNLEPDGSYYISAILEDGRGRRSPLKVIAFTTPDDTQPAFVDDYPYMSKVSCEVAQVTTMANKNCRLYWVLLPAGAAVPTAQNFRSNSFGASYGSGSQSVVKNVPVSITVNTARLQEDTYYDLYLWLNDYDGAMNSEVIHVTHSSAAGTKYSFRTPDETPPVVATPFQSDFNQTAAAAVTFSINEAPSTLYWAVVTEGNESFITEDMSEQRRQLKVEFGTGAIVSGSKAAAGAGVDTEIGINEIKGLDYATYGTHSFKFYYVAKDAAGNYSEVKYIVIHTLDADPPHAWLEYSDAVNGNPRANSDIRIVFDEQVQGGANATQTFLEFYEIVRNAAAAAEADSRYQSNLNTAKNNLARELAAHIKLYYSPRNGSPQLQTPRHELSDSAAWVIDFREAVIGMDRGKLVITLPGEAHDGMGKALNLDSGANYQFRLVGVYDTAFTPNGIAVDEKDETTCVPEGGKKSDNGNGTLYFTTLYAQVELFENTSVAKIDSGNAIAPDYRLDLVVDVVPQSTEKVPDTEYWDLIMWSSTVMKVDVYRKVFNKDGTEITDTDSAYYGKGWVKVNNNVIQFNSAKAGVGLSYTKDPTQPQYEIVTTGLAEGYLYRYGIHITSMGIDNISEGDDPTAEPTSWSDLITMEFSLIAGTEGNVRDVSRLVNTNYDGYLNTAKISEIGVVYTDEDTKSILECSKQFVDTQPPQFMSGSPTFEVGSGSMTIAVALDRPGRVYYVVAPVGALTINTGSKRVTVDNDGREVSGGNIHASGDFTYIPEDGDDRDNGDYADDILFTRASGSKMYASPTYLQVYNGSSTWRNNAKVKTGYKDVDSSATIEYITVDGLDSKTQYYICIVLEGYGGGHDEIVQIYRQDTTVPRVPEVIVTGTSTSAIISTTEDCEMSIVLVEYNSLPSSIRGNGGANTPLYQMMYRANNRTDGPSIFDISGSDGNKNNVLQYVTGTSGGTSTSVAGSWKLPGVGPDGKTYSEITKGTTLTFDFDDYMTSAASEYVVLVVARHHSGGTTIMDYGYGAARGLYTPDKVPPEFVNGNYDPLYLEASITGCSNETAWSQGWWQERPNIYTYSGSITIRFSKNIYWHNIEDNTMYTIVYDKKPTASKEGENPKKYIGDLIESSATITFSRDSGSVTNSFTITFSGISAYQTITFPSDGWLCNGSDYSNKKILTLTFDPNLTSANFTKGVVTPIGQPGFKVSWE